MDTQMPTSISPEVTILGSPPPMAPVVTVKEWMLTILIMCIPLVNIIMMFVWAFGGGNNPSKANYFKASLIFAAIILGLYIVFGVIIIGILGATFYNTNWE